MIQTGTLKELISLSDWDVTLDTPEKGKPAWYGRVGSHGFIRIMSGNAPEELAVDAFLDFLDTLRERRYPKHITDPSDIMAYCVVQARRQR